MQVASDERGHGLFLPGASAPCPLPPPRRCSAAARLRPLIHLADPIRSLFDLRPRLRDALRLPVELPFDTPPVAHNCGWFVDYSQLSLAPKRLTEKDRSSMFTQDTVFIPSDSPWGSFLNRLPYIFQKLKPVASGALSKKNEFLHGGRKKLSIEGTTFSV